MATIEAGEHTNNPQILNRKSCDFITNRQLLDLRTKSSSDNDTTSKLISDNAAYRNCNFNSLRRKAQSVYDKVKKLKRNHKNVDVYLDSNFEPPIEKTEKILTQISDENQKILAEKIVVKTKVVVEENRTLKRQFESVKVENEGLREKVDTLSSRLRGSVEVLQQISVKYDECVRKNDENQLRQELIETREQFRKQSSNVTEISVKLKEAQQKLSKYATRNVNKKLKRKDDKIDNLKQKVKETEQVNASLRLELLDKNEENATIHKLKSEKHSIQKTLSKLRQQVSKLKERNDDIENSYEDELLELNKKININEREINRLHGLVELMESNVVSTFCDGKYSDEVRECCMSLLTECNVSLSKLPDIIKVVLSTFTGKVPERLPSKTLLSWMMAEAKVIASRHVASEMLKDLDENLDENVGHVLHQDATTKFHQHFEGAQVTLVDGRSLTIGLKEVGGGEGMTYVEAVKEMVHDLAQSLGDKDKHSAEIITSIKHFMNDQCATNGVFSAAIEELRKEFLPAVHKNFETLSQEEKEAVCDMGKFACRLHLLANFGIDANKALLAYEESVSEGKNPHAFKNDGDSGSFRLCRTAAKALTKRGSAKAGVHAYWDAFLRGKGQVNKLVTYQGHRINIVFHEGAAVYHHRKDIADFVNDWPDQNGLVSALAFDIKEPAYIAGCRALGMFDKLVTGPFWRILEQEGSIFDLNEDLLQMQLTLTSWAQDGSLPFSGEPMFGEKASVTKDDLYESLFGESANPTEDALTIMALELLSSQLLVLLERQAKTQLPEGDYANPSEEFKRSAMNVPKTNTISERDMAVLDNLLRTKPAASSLTLEVLVMCSKNKPFAWLKSLTDETRAEILASARKQSKGVKEEFMRRKEKLEKKIEEKLKEKKKKKEAKEAKEINVNFSLSREITKYGGPWTADEISDKEEKLGIEFRDALLTQIKFHKQVLKSKGSRELFQESTNKKKYTTEQLKENLITIIEMNGVNENENEKSVGLLYKDIEESKREIQSRKTSITKQLIKAREKRKIDQQKHHLNLYLEAPEKLVGKNIQHKCVHENSEIWFRAKVICIEKEHQNKLKTEYKVMYEEFEEEDWHSYPLLGDMKKGDVLVEKD